MSVFEQLGPLALATRLKLLSESLAKDVANIYRQLNLPFEPRWFTLFWTLKHKPGLTITELAQELRQTHAAAVQLSNLLEKKGLVYSTKDKNDERRRQVSLTAKGISLFEEITPVLKAIEQANRDLLLLTAPDFLNKLEALELALDQKSMHNRILDFLGMNEQGITIRAFVPADKAALIKLHQEWIAECSGMPAATDAPMPELPQEEMIKSGGMIYLALYNLEPIGAATIQQSLAGHYFISMFTVKREFRSKGLGKALLNQCISFAKAKEADALQVSVSPAMVDTINFFIKKGFLMTPLNPQESAHHRYFINMSLSLEK